jgi:hypothetical protein
VDKKNEDPINGEEKDNQINVLPATHTVGVTIPQPSGGVDLLNPDQLDNSGMVSSQDRSAALNSSNPNEDNPNNNPNSVEGELAEENNAPLIQKATASPAHPVDKRKKLLNSKVNQRGAICFNFSFIAGLYILYFVLNFVGESNYLSYVKNNFDHLRLISQGKPQIRYLLAFTQEEIAENDTTSVYYYPSRIIILINLMSV